MLDIDTWQEILDASDGIMVARGDLAVEVGNAAVPALQKRMIRMARALDKVPWKASGTPFQLKVWETLCSIPAGEFSNHSVIPRRAIETRAPALDTASVRYRLS